MPPPRRGKGKGKGKFGKDKKDKGQRALFRRRKFCRFTAEKVEWIDYKDVEMLKDFVNENRQDHPGAHHRHRGGLPAPAVARRSSGRASWRSCRTPTCTEATWKSSFWKRSPTWASSARW